MKLSEFRRGDRGKDRLHPEWTFEVLSVEPLRIQWYLNNTLRGSVENVLEEGTEDYYTDGDFTWEESTLVERLLEKYEM
jgi:hypothetical protein